jgi:thioesterase domain-containing protein
MARQLEAAGEKVSSLILLSVDGSNAEFSWLERLISLPPGRADRKFQTFIKWRERILFVRAAMRQQLAELATPVPLSRQTGRIARKAGRVLQKVFGLMLPRPAQGASAMDTLQPEAAGIDIGLIYHQACAAYVPRPYQGSAHVLWPSEMTLRDSSAGWASVMSRINLVQVPGGHFSSLQGENLLAVSDQIRACLEVDGA